MLVYSLAHFVTAKRRLVPSFRALPQNTTMMQVWMRVYSEHRGLDAATHIYRSVYRYASLIDGDTF